MILYVHQVFSQRFKKRNAIHISKWLVDFPSIDPMEATNLEAPFEEDELLSALMEAEGYKAPGPNGFPFWFF